MTWLIVGIILFFGVHLITPCTWTRAKLVGWMGENPYKGVYSLVSLVGLVCMGRGMARAEDVDIWSTPASASLIAAVLMAPALILLAASHSNGNIERVVRHPMAWGVLLWSLAHLLSNGDLASVLLFGSFAAYSIFNMLTSDGVSVTATSIGKDIRSIVIGFIVYALLVVFHSTLFGVALAL